MRRVYERAQGARPVCREGVRKWCLRCDIYVYVTIVNLPAPGVLVARRWRRWRRLRRSWLANTRASCDPPAFLPLHTTLTRNRVSKGVLWCGKTLLISHFDSFSSACINACDRSPSPKLFAITRKNICFFLFSFYLIFGRFFFFFLFIMWHSYEIFLTLCY